MIAKLPKNFDHNKHLLKVVQQVHNRRVTNSFKDVVADKNGTQTSKGRQSVYTACQVQRNDTWLQVIVRFLLFYLVLGNSRIEAIATVPEFWSLKTPRNRSQLCVLYKEKNQRGYGSTTYQITIPNYNGSMKPTGIPHFKKGSHLGTLHLQDGSKLRVNAYDDAEAKRVIDILKTYIRKPALKDAVFTVGQRKDKLKEVEIHPTRADFYPRGKKKGLEPKWRHPF